MPSEKTRGYVLGAVAAASYGLNPLFALPLYEGDSIRIRSFFTVICWLSSCWER